MIPYTEIVPTRWGHMIALRCDPYQYQALALYGEWAPDEVSICLQCIKPGDIVLDVGANIGTTVIPFAQRVGPGGAVFAFEPQRLPFLCLCGNIALASVGEWTRPANAALGEAHGTTTIAQIDPRQPNNAGGVRCGDTKYDHYLKTSGERTQCPVRTIDGLQLDGLNFLKIDVEGMESKVLKGGEQTIAKYKPVIWAEVLPQEPENRKAMAAFFAKHGYKVWEFITPIFSKDNVRGNQHNAFKEQADWNVLAVHESQEPPECVQWVNEFKP